LRYLELPESRRVARSVRDVEFTGDRRRFALW